MNARIGIIGVGNMGSAIARALLPFSDSRESENGASDFSLFVCDRDAQKFAALRDVHTTTDMRALVSGVDVVVLAVKPQSFPELVEGLGSGIGDKLFISIMAGISIAELAAKTKATRIIRAMPNLAAQVGESMTGWVATLGVNVEDRVIVKKIFSAMGKEAELSDEHSIDAITALSGSGPAYFFYLCELLAQKAQAMGFTPEQSRIIAEQTLIGAATTLGSGDKSAAEWRNAVTSKGGTTEAALAILQSHRFTQTFFEAINAAQKRAQELSGDSKVVLDTLEQYSSSEAKRSREVPSGLTTALASVRAASQTLGTLPEQKINEVLHALAAAVRRSASTILAANKNDLARMDANDPRYDRLQLTSERLDGVTRDIETVAALPSPLGRVLQEQTLPNGLDLKKVSVPLGVVGIIYEARPNVTFDVFCLCFKSGNACVLKGGSEAYESNRAIVSLMQSVLEQHGVSRDVIYLAPKEREATEELLRAREFVDVMIPRGSQALIDYVREHSKIPVIETGAGIVHTYFDVSGDLGMGQKIIENAKTRRYSVCNALDTLIVHADRLRDLPALVTPLAPHCVEIFADAQAHAVLEGAYPSELLQDAAAEHFGTEFLSPKMSIKTVANLDEALKHIARYGSKHSEAIIATDKAAIEKFLATVDAAVVYANASTAFTDGAQFGMGAEIGISTQKLHARGPMALPELTTYKWVVHGSGQIRPR